MQIFLSHSSRQKPLVREIKKHLPAHLESWLDEQKLLFGDSIPQSIESTIQSDTDYVLLFIDDYAVASSWVAKELEWTLGNYRLELSTWIVYIHQASISKRLARPAKKLKSRRR